jgi:hypothetical protein
MPLKKKSAEVVAEGAPLEGSKEISLVTDETVYMCQQMVGGHASCLCRNTAQAL